MGIDRENLSFAVEKYFETKKKKKMDISSTCINRKT